MVYTITNTLTNLTASGDTTITSTATVTLSAATGYRVPANITVSGADYTYDDYTDVTKGVISLSNPTGNVTITAVGLTEEERFNSDMDGIVDVINAKAGTTGEKYLPQVKHTAKTIVPLSDAPAKSSTDLTVSGNVVTVPAGYYAAQATKAVGTSKAAATITPTGQAQTIAAGQYLAGAQTVEAVVCENLSAANVKEGVTVKIGTATDDDSVTTVTGTYEGGGGGLINYVRFKLGNFPDKYLDPGTSAGSVTFVLLENYYTTRWINNPISKTFTWTAEENIESVCTSFEELCDFLDIDISTLHTNERNWYCQLYVSTSTDTSTEWVEHFSFGGSGSDWGASWEGYTPNANKKITIKSYANAGIFDVSDGNRAVSILIESSWEDD